MKVELPVQLLSSIHPSIKEEKRWIDIAGRRVPLESQKTYILKNSFLKDERRAWPKVQCLDGSGAVIQHRQFPRDKVVVVHTSISFYIFVL